MLSLPAEHGATGETITEFEFVGDNSARGHLLAAHTDLVNRSLSNYIDTKYGIT